jgi:hypothetical protein
MFDPVQFPRIHGEGYVETSRKSESYNCIAWAMHDQEKWWWPVGKDVQDKEAYWPKQARKGLKLRSFTEAFKTRGWSPCKDGTLEEGFEKVALYADGQTPTHAALQLIDGS